MASFVFADTDVCLDLLTGKKPHNHFAELLFSMADRNEIKIGVSSLSFSHIDYILKAHFKLGDSRNIISRFKTLVSVLSVNDKIIELAIASDFEDFEDAIQYYTAIENSIHIFVTRNLKDFKKARIQVLTPDMLLKRI
ncbi:MAG: type II toxin-antitoxin system VapC family toxin [Bacteroidota bacterium]